MGRQKDFSVLIEDELCLVSFMNMQTPEGLQIVCLRPLGRVRKDGSRRPMKRYSSGIITTNGKVIRKRAWM